MNKALVFLFFLLPLAHAKFIKMNVKNNASITDGAMVLNTTILNEGDDTSLDVFLEFIEFNKKIKIADKLGPNESVEKVIKFSKKDLNLTQPGEYLSPYRIVYDDLNHVTYTSPQLLKYVHLESGISPVSIVVNLKNKKLTLSDKGKVEFSIRNTISKEAKIKKVNVFSTNEIGLKLNHSKELDLVIASGESKKFSLDLENLSGRDKSNYQVFILAQGDYQDRIYSASNFFFASIDDSAQEKQALNPFFLFLFVAIGVLGAGVFFGKNSRNSKKS